MRFFIRRLHEPGKAVKLDVLRLAQWLDRAIFPADDQLTGDDFSKAYWWVAAIEETGAPAAFAGLRHRYASRGFLCQAGVLPAYRGKGLQRRLIRVRENAARRLGWERLLTYTAVDNHASGNNLIRCGYRLWDHTDGFLHWYRDLE